MFYPKGSWEKRWDGLKYLAPGHFVLEITYPS